MEVQAQNIKQKATIFILNRINFQFWRKIEILGKGVVFTKQY